MALKKDSALTSATPVMTDAVRGLDDPGGTPISVTFLLSAIYDLFKASFDLLYTTLVAPGTVGSLITSDGASWTSALPSIRQTSKSEAYVFVLADGGSHILHPTADTTARTFTIPANASVAYPIGTAITIINQHGAGVVTIAINTDTLYFAGAGTTGSRTLAANGMATAIKVASTEWLISGIGLT